MTPQPPTVFIYPLPADQRALHLYDHLGPDDHDYQFAGELELYRRLLAYPHQAPAATADMLLVPSMLVQAFAQWKKSASGDGHIRRLSAKIEASLTEYGPYWETRRRAHAIFALRCGGPPWDRVRRSAVALGRWPSLWDSNATMLCVEPTHDRVHGRGVVMPYHSTARCAPSAAPRPSLLHFAGSPMSAPLGRTRTGWIGALQRLGPPNASLYIIDAKSNGIRERMHFNFSALVDGLAASTFSLTLRGHTGVRKSVFDAIKCGTLPLLAYERTPLPFARRVNYSRFALRVPANAAPGAVVERLRRWVSARPDWMRAAAAAVREAAELLSYSGGVARLTLEEFVEVTRAEGSGRGPWGGRSQFERGSTDTPVPLWRD